MISPTVSVRCPGSVPDAAEHGPDAGLQVLGGVRLDHVVVGACIEKADDLLLVVSRRCDNHRHIRHRSNHAEGFGAVDVRQTEIEHHHVERSGDGGLDTGHRRPCGVHLVTALGEPTRERLPDPLVVFNDENGGHGITIPKGVLVDRGCSSI